MLRSGPTTVRSSRGSATCSGWPNSTMAPHTLLSGTSTKFNWWGYWTAKAAAKESFEQAMGSLRQRMAQEPLIP